MNFPSLAGLSLLPAPGNTEIAVSPHWTCDHAIVIDCGLVDLAPDDDGEDDGGEFEVVFEPDFSLDDDDDEDGEVGGGLPGRLDRDEEDEEDDWPP